MSQQQLLPVTSGMGLLPVTPDVIGSKPIAVLLQPISGLSAINPLVAFYDPWRKERGAILLFCPGHTRRGCIINMISYAIIKTLLQIFTEYKST
jgi:hypothetical protein